MCGRFALSAKSGTIEKLMPDINILTDVVERFNIAPTQTIYMINQESLGYQLDGVKWGLIPSWAKDMTLASKMINARAETLFEKPSFRNLITRKRCLVIASGYYEWQKIPVQSKKQPHYITMSDKSLMTFGGLWDRWRAPSGEVIMTATIITCQPNEYLKTIHDRMPLIIPEDKRIDWLNPIISKENIAGMMATFPGELMTAYPVSFAVNSPTNDTSICIEAI
jgi:putative SOS response-associated peptidase YedK